MTGQIFVLSRDRVIFRVRFSSVVQKRSRRLEGGEIMSIILLTRDSCFNRTRTNLGAERLCKNGSSEGSGRKPRYICRVKQLLMTVFELFCLQNSLIVGVQPQVSGKVGSLVGSFLGGQCSAFPTTVEFYRKASCRGRNKNADENARKILLLKRHYESVLISFA